MMIKRFTFPFVLCCLLTCNVAKSEINITFEDPNSYKSLGVYDVWEESPFRTGQLKGNWGITLNPDKSINESLGKSSNDSEKVLGAQRSRYGSNRFGVKVDLNEPFKLSPDTLYVHVMVHKPKDGRVMLVGLGSREERIGQNPYTEQFWVLSETPVATDSWFDAVFPVRGANGIDVRSLVIVPDCESPHNLKEDFLFYVDNITVNNSPDSRIPIVNKDDDTSLSSVSKDFVTVNDSQLNGEVLAADGSKLDSYKIPYNQSFKIKVAPEKGFHNGGIDIFVFSQGENNDKTKASKYHIPPEKFDKDNSYTITADLIKGNILIQGIMKEDKAD